VIPIESRLADLKDNIQQDLDLLKDYEDILRYEEDPRRMIKYRREILRYQKSAECYQQEYDRLQAQIAAEFIVEREGEEDQLQQVHSILIQLQSRIDNLQSGQEAILNKLDTQHQEVLSQFDASDQSIVASIIRCLDQSQLESVKIILNAIESSRISNQEINEILVAVRQVLAEIQPVAVVSNLLLAKETATFSKLLDDPKADLSHKLKVTIPLIPMLISYESEIALNSGANLKSAWQILKTKLKS